MEQILSELQGQLVIVHQPIKKYRFRHARKFPSIAGISGRHHEYPVVELLNYPNDGSAAVVVSLYLLNYDQKHFHRLVGQNCYDNGECVTLMENNKLVLRNVAINLMKKEDICATLGKQRVSNFDAAPDEESIVSEFKQLEEKLQLGHARLRFQAFHKQTQQLIGKPVFSEPIINTKPLKILHLSKQSSACTGGKQMTMICQNWKSDVRVRFYKKNKIGKTIWERWIPPDNVICFCQVGVVFNIPPYQDISLTTPVPVYVQLCGSQGNSFPKAFTYKPLKKANVYAFRNIHERKIRRKRLNNIGLLAPPVCWPHESHHVSEDNGTLPEMLSQMSIDAELDSEGRNYLEKS